MTEAQRRRLTVEARDVQVGDRLLISNEWHEVLQRTADWPVGWTIVRVQGYKSPRAYADERTVTVLRSSND